MSYDRNARMLALGYTYAPARERWYTIEVVANPVGKNIQYVNSHVLSNLEVVILMTSTN